MRRAFTLAVTAVLLPVGAALAQPASPDAASTTNDQGASAVVDQLNKEFASLNHQAADSSVFTFDYDVPASPALALLGLTDDKITQSNSLKPFVLALPGVISGQDSSKAIAVEISPLIFASRRGRSFGDYAGTGDAVFADLRDDEPSPAPRVDLFTQALERAHLSAGLYAGVADPDPAKQVRSRVAVGISTSLLSSSDPALARLPGGAHSAFRECLYTGWKTISDNLEQQTMSGLAALDQAYYAFSPKILRVKTRLAQASAAGDRAEADAAAQELAQLQAGQAAAEKVSVDAHTRSQQSAHDSFAKSDAAKVVPACKSVADVVARTGPDFSIGAGAVWQGTPGKVSQLTDEASVIWASFRYPLWRPEPMVASDWRAMETWADNLDSWMMIGFSGRAGWHEFIPTGVAATPLVRVNRYTGWVGLEWNRPDARLTAQIGREKIEANDPSGAAFSGARTRYLVAGDYKLGNTGLWVNLSYGKADGVGQLKSDAVTKLTFSYSTPPPASVLEEKQAVSGQ